MKKIIKLCCGCAATVLLLGLAGGCGTPSSKTTAAAPANVSEEATWQIEDTTVYGTVTHPAAGAKFPAVLFIAGSGPTDWDWNSPLIAGKNGSGKLLAEALAGKGYLTLRYDKRFTGPHAQENLPKLTGKISMQGHLDEIAGAINNLLARKDVDPNRIYILGNSEGTIHAVNYYFAPGSHKLAGLILTGAPGQPLKDLMRAQLAAQLANYPGGDNIMSLYDKAIQEFIDTGKVTIDPSLPDGIKQLIASLTAPVNMPFTQEFLSADIAPQMQQIDIPVLVVIGKKDIQVNWEVDGAKLQAAAAGKANITFNFPDNANHILEYEAKDKSAINLTDPGYNTPDRVLDGPTVDTITAWLDSHK